MENSFLSEASAGVSLGLLSVLWAWGTEALALQTLSVGPLGALAILCHHCVFFFLESAP